uniref:Protein phosphatase 1 regulatory subunit 3C2, duplicate b n=1 Tax=Oryzias melastigma TaxID=30732 RepID=A0A3B3BTG3_ORYME
MRFISASPFTSYVFVCDPLHASESWIPWCLVEIAVRLCLDQRKQLCPHVWVPILKPLRPCIHDDILTPIKEKRVVFADSQGFSLTDVRLFSDEEEEQSDLDLLPTLQDLGSMTGDGYSCTVSTSCPGTSLKLGFAQPSLDFQAFRSKLAESMVILECCTISEQTLRGTVRVRNITFQKDVRMRITFNSWLSYRDVPCTYLQKRFGGPQTDIFEFSTDIPKVIDAKRRIEFCFIYLPVGYSEPFWDNNYGKNYSISVCVNSHLCCGKRMKDRLLLKSKLDLKVSFSTFWQGLGKKKLLKITCVYVFKQFHGCQEDT